MNNFCDYFNKGICNSCDLIEIDYLDQITAKESTLKQGLENLGPFELLTTIHSSPRGFRNKAKLVVTGSLENPTIGLSGETQLDQGREIINCPVHHPKINLVLEKIPSFIKMCHLIPYNIKERTGELKGLILFYSETSNEMYLRFVLRSKESLDRIKIKSQYLMEAFPFIKCMTINIQPIPHAILEGNEEILIAGKESILHKLKEIELEIHPRAFVQTNQSVSTALYETASKWIDALKVEKFCELYCGQGAFSFFVAPKVTQALGIEINEQAVQMANSLALKMGYHHLKFIAEDAASVENTLTQFSPEVVLVNPPRKGLGGALSHLKKTTFPYLLYSSCSSKSLASDLEELENYHIIKAQIFDMFPHTSHFETLVLLKAK